MIVNASAMYRTTLATIFQTMMPHQHIYHYTSPKTALEILETKDKCGFCCTHYSFLNDDGEFSLGIKIVLDWLRNLFRKGKQFEGIINRVEELLRPTVERAIVSNFTPWILSFSGNGDSLSQWASYTDHEKGGCAIGVNFDNLIEAITPLRSKEWIDERDTWIVAPCVYVDVRDDRAERGAEFAIIDRLFEFCGGFELLKSKNAVLRFARIAVLFAALVKSKDFSSEQEWRVVHLTDDSFDYQQVEIIGGKPRIRLLHRGDALVGKLVVSHHGNRVYLKAMADILAQKYSYIVRESKVSYTGM